MFSKISRKPQPKGPLKSHKNPKKNPFESQKIPKPKGGDKEMYSLINITAGGGEKLSHTRVTHTHNPDTPKIHSLPSLDTLRAGHSWRFKISPFSSKIKEQKKYGFSFCFIQ